MADAYAFVKSGKLNIKGDKHKKHKKHKKRKHEESSLEVDTNSNKRRDDAKEHGGWWSVSELKEVSGNIVIEKGTSGQYITALDNGLFALAKPFQKGQEPSPEEIMTAIKIDETKVAFKSGFGKYLSVNQDCVVVGRSDAIGSREQWEPVFQENKVALNGCNGKFLSVNEDGQILCLSKTAGENEFLQVRSSLGLEVDPTANVPKEERGTMKESEIRYVQKFQSYEDRRLRINEGDIRDLKKARTEGQLYETLLDRRAKMKADRYCK